MKARALSLFAGAGGFDIGVDQAGFKTVCSVELDPHCVSTLRRNGRGKTAWQVDVRALDPLRMADSLGFGVGELALLYGGPPCQPFSQMGKRKGVADSRGGLVFEMVRFAEALRPAAALIEQVPSFLNARISESASMKDVLIERFARIGYDTHVEVLNASRFGVPQLRKRAIIACVPSGTKFSFPIGNIDAPPTAGEALKNLPAPAPPGEGPLPTEMRPGVSGGRYRNTVVALSFNGGVQGRRAPPKASQSRVDLPASPASAFVRTIFISQRCSGAT